jgi:hypothetical protein
MPSALFHSCSVPRRRPSVPHRRRPSRSPCPRSLVRHLPSKCSLGVCRHRRRASGRSLCSRISMISRRASFLKAEPLTRRATSGSSRLAAAGCPILLQTRSWSRFSTAIRKERSVRHASRRARDGMTASFTSRPATSASWSTIRRRSNSVRLFRRSTTNCSRVRMISTSMPRATCISPIHGEQDLAPTRRIAPVRSIRIRRTGLSGASSPPVIFPTA